ncbi:MAG: NUDIX hydrolase [Thaumarchaeota archaeon]|nr:NUDIX hydrolase [Candidatus Calditenuaceae archaeon]MDW8187413.1 NUDIX hydrolase [Nitrososphaerota archaeon]
MRLRVLEVRRIYSGRTVGLRVEKIAIDGKVIEREIVEHRGAAVVVPWREDGKLVLIRQYRRAVNSELLEFPAGTLEPGEDAESCARRELLEETGHQALSLERLATLYPAPGYTEEVMHVFLARAVPKGPPSPEDDEEGMKVVTMTLDELIEMILKGEVSDAKTVVGAFMLKERVQGCLTGKG